MLESSALLQIHFLCVAVKDHTCVIIRIMNVKREKLKEYESKVVLKVVIQNHSSACEKKDPLTCKNTLSI